MKYLSALFPGMGLYGYLIAAGISALLAIGGTHYFDSLYYGKTIQGLQLAAETKRANDNGASLTQLQGFINGIHLSQVNYQNTLDAIAASIKTAANGWKNATATPLPKDCLPNADRMRAVSSAISAANRATATAP